MKTIITSLAIMIATISVSWSQYVDPMYAPKKSKEQIKQEKEQNKKQKEIKETFRSSGQRYGDYQRDLAVISNYQINRDSILVTTLDEALLRRVDAATASVYPSQSMMDALDDYAAVLQQIYSPNLYNVIIFADRIWVEPKYITSIFNGDSEAALGVNAYLEAAIDAIERQRFEEQFSYSPYMYNRYTGYGWGSPWGRPSWWGRPAGWRNGGYYGMYSYPYSPWGYGYLWGYNNMWGYNYYYPGYSSFMWGFNSYWNYGGIYNPYFPYPNHQSMSSRPIYYGNSRSEVIGGGQTYAPSATPSYNRTSTAAYGSGQKTTTSTVRSTTTTTSVAPSTSTSTGYSGGFTTSSGGTTRRR